MELHGVIIAIFFLRLITVHSAYTISQFLLIVFLYPPLLFNFNRSAHPR